MSKPQWAVSSVPELREAFESWPGEPYEKGLLRALLLRVEIEHVATTLPRTVILTGNDKGHVHRRLMLSIGEPNLDGPAQSRRLRVVRTAIATYEAICDSLHGRNPDPYPPISELKAWTEAVERLKEELSA